MNIQNKRKKGFTLIELLVVITIIGILAGIAFVGFGDVFGSAGRTTAQKNLKTVYEALAAKTRSFPMSEDVGSVEEFVVWWRNKTKDTRPELWFIGEDEEVKDLESLRIFLMMMEILMPIRSRPLDIAWLYLAKPQKQETFLPILRAELFQ